MASYYKHCPDCGKTTRLTAEGECSVCIDRLAEIGVIAAAAGEQWRVANSFVTLDSGQREEFTTGSRRDSRAGKGRFDLLPWRAIERWAQLLERGAIKYGERNWELGQPLDRYFDSAIRHLVKWQAGERDEDHLAAALFNVGAILWTEEELEAGRLPEELRK